MPGLVDVQYFTWSWEVVQIGSLSAANSKWLNLKPQRQSPDLKGVWEYAR